MSVGLKRCRGVGGAGDRFTRDIGCSVSNRCVCRRLSSCGVWSISRGWFEWLLTCSSSAVLLQLVWCHFDLFCDQLVVVFFLFWVGFLRRRNSGSFCWYECVILRHCGVNISVVRDVYCSECCISQPEVSFWVGKWWISLSTVFIAFSGYKHSR